MEQDKRHRRLAKNREAAKKSRNRKKHYLEFLEKKVAALSETACSLRQQMLKKPKKESLRDAVIGGEDLESSVSKFQEKLEQTCFQRKDQIEFLVDEVVRVMIPSHAKLLLKSVKETEVEVPELSPQQLATIKELQPVLAQEQSRLQEIVDELSSTKQDILELLDWGACIPKELRKFMTPQQTAEILMSYEQDSN